MESKVGVNDEQWVTDDVDDKDDSYEGKFNPNFILNSSSTHLIFNIFFLSPTNKDDGIGDIYRNNNPALDKRFEQRVLMLLLLLLLMMMIMMIHGCWMIVSIGSMFYLSMKSLFPPLSYFHYSTSLFLYPLICIYTGTRFINKRKELVSLMIQGCWLTVFHSVFQILCPLMILKMWLGTTILALDDQGG